MVKVPNMWVRDWKLDRRRRVSGRPLSAIGGFLFRLKKMKKATVVGKYRLVKSTWKRRDHWRFWREMMFIQWQCSYSIFGRDASNRKWNCKCSSPWKPRLGEKMAWGKQLLRKSNGGVSVTPRTFPWGFFTRYIILSISVQEQIKVNPCRVHGMPKMFSPSCVLAVLLILSSFGASWQGKPGKKGSYSVPLLRTKRDLRDSRGNPTENLKGRPGQGYYISTDLGTPAQRVSSEELLFAMFMVI